MQPKLNFLGKFRSAVFKAVSLGAICVVDPLLVSFNDLSKVSRNFFFHGQNLADCFLVMMNTNFSLVNDVQIFKAQKLLSLRLTA